jgi:hypothetical protein
MWSCATRSDDRVERKKVMALAQAEALMRDRGISEAPLSVLGANTRAIALYRRLDWVEFRYFVSRINGQTYFRMNKQLCLAIPAGPRCHRSQPIDRVTL